MHRATLLPALALALGAAAVSGQDAAAAEMPAPPTKEQTAGFAAYGRTLPPPEILQPMLDPALPDFKPREDRNLRAHLRGAASDVLANLSHRWIGAFARYYPEVVVETAPPYSGRYGAQELVSGKIDFALVSRELVPTDVAGFRAKFGYDPLSVPIMGGSYRHFGFLDAIGVFVNRENPLSKLTFTQLDALLSTTRYRGGGPIRTWGQLGLKGEWADAPIHVWAVKPWNGFEEFVRERALSTPGHRGEWRTDLNFGETVFPIAPAVAGDRYAIGYAGLAYLSPGVKLVALAADDGGPYVPPSYEEVALARYPLSRLVYCNVNQPPNAALPPALAEFIRFLVSRQGQEVVHDQAIFIPLRAEQAERSLALLH